MLPVEDRKFILNKFNEGVASKAFAINQSLGRIQVQTHLGIETDKLVDIISNSIYLGDLELRAIDTVEYNSEFGEPSLPPHYDGDNTEVIVNYQLSSNTNWGVGVDEQVFYIEDNTAIAFNPNEHIHWRPIKKFEPGEYVRMVFFRFYDPRNHKDNTHLKLSQDDPVFDKIRAIRESGTV